MSRFHSTLIISAPRDVTHLLSPCSCSFVLLQTWQDWGRVCARLWKCESMLSSPNCVEHFYLVYLLSILMVWVNFGFVASALCIFPVAVFSKWIIVRSCINEVCAFVSPTPVTFPHSAELFSHYLSPLFLSQTFPDLIMKVLSLSRWYHEHKIVDKLRQSSWGCCGNDKT